MKSRPYIYVESPQKPLMIVSKNLNESAVITNPTTGEDYKGIILEGIFAELTKTPNNNKRVYDIPQYVELVDKLKQQIEAEKGVYGELEHPDKYSINFNNVSHKIIDIWYKQTSEGLTVYGKVLLLDTPKGKIAQEIVKSGGQLAISARAAGEEIKQPDGTMKAVTKLLTTYDLVYHPGFSSAVLKFKQLNESEQILQNASEKKQGYGYKIYINQFKNINESYQEYLKEGDRSKCFMEWYGIQSLFENDSFLESQEDSDEEKLENNQPIDKKQEQKKLENAVTDELQQSQYWGDIENSQRNKFRNLDRTVFDGSAGFETFGVGLPNLSQKQKRKSRNFNININSKST